MSRNGFKELETERLILRKISINDAKEIFETWTNNDNVSRYTTWPTHKDTNDTIEWLEIVEKEYENNINYEWGITLKDSGKLIGTISAYIREEYDNRDELGYVLAVDYWRHGYTTESAKAVMDYLANSEGITKFIGRHAKLNPASGAVMQKCGFRYIKDGTFKKFDESAIYETNEYYYDVYENIKKPNIEDAREIGILIKEGWNTAYKGLIDDDFLNNLDVERLTNRWTKCIEDNKNVLVYKEENKVLGVIEFGKSETNNDNGEIQVLYVKPEEKRKGIGTKLFDTAKQELLKQRYKYLDVWCLDKNTIGENFYTKSGGKKTKNRIYKVNGLDLNENLFEFELRKNLDIIKLVRPTKEHEEALQEYKQEHYNHGEKEIHACARLDKMDNFDDWLKQVENNSKKETASKNWTVSSTFLGIRELDNKIVGMIDIRHELNSDFLRNYAGNIGYGVRPTERKKGYATQMLDNALRYCKNEIGLDKVMINCYKNNEPSRKTIINAGGILDRECEREGKTIQFYFINL